MGDDDRRTAGDGRRIPRVLARHEHERRRAVEEGVDVCALVQQFRRHDRGAVQDRVMQGRPFSPERVNFMGLDAVGTVVLRTLQNAS